MISNIRECSELSEKDKLDNDVCQPRSRHRSISSPHSQETGPKPELHIAVSNDEVNKAVEPMTHTTIDTSSKAGSDRALSGIQTPPLFIYQNIVNSCYF